MRRYIFAILCLIGTIYGDNSLEIGGNCTHAHLKVQDQSFHGNLGGVQGYYAYQACNGFYGGFRVVWKEGTLKDSSAHRKLNYVDVQERIGYTFLSCCEDWSLTLFTGFGYRFLSHKLKQSDEKIKFKYNEFYVPVGFLSEYYFLPCWSLGLNFTWMPQVYPTVEIIPLKGARWVLTNTVSNVYVELPLTYYFTDACYALVLKPFYEHWEDGRSTARSASGQELGLPKNFYNFWGLELNFDFSF